MSVVDVVDVVVGVVVTFSVVMWVSMMMTLLPVHLFWFWDVFLEGCFIFVLFCFVCFVLVCFGLFFGCSSFCEVQMIGVVLFFPC